MLIKKLSETTNLQQMASNQNMFLFLHQLEVVKQKFLRIVFTFIEEGILQINNVLNFH